METTRRPSKNRNLSNPNWRRLAEKWTNGRRSVVLVPTSIDSAGRVTGDDKDARRITLPASWTRTGFLFSNREEVGR